MELTRRDFFKASAAGGAAVAWGSFGFDLRPAYAETTQLKISRANEVRTICPYCAVGCSILAYTKQDASGNTRLLQIEGNPDSPVNEGRLCPKGATSMQLAVSNRRVEKPLYRAPGSDKWQEIDWDQMLDRLARHVKESRDATFVTQDSEGRTVNRCEGVAFAGGATFSSEEGYFATKLMRALGVVHLEQQARV